MHLLTLTLLLCIAVSISSAGYCYNIPCCYRWLNWLCGGRTCKECCAGYTGNYCSVDIDECEEGTHDCSHYCTNTYGSYYCSCRSGYKLSSDRKTCVRYYAPCASTCYSTCRTWLFTSYECTTPCPSGPGCET